MEQSAERSPVPRPIDINDGHERLVVAASYLNSTELSTSGRNETGFRYTAEYLASLPADVLAGKLERVDQGLRELAERRAQRRQGAETTASDGSLAPPRRQPGIDLAERGITLPEPRAELTTGLGGRAVAQTVDFSSDI